MSMPTKGKHHHLSHHHHHSQQQQQQQHQQHQQQAHHNPQHQPPPPLIVTVNQSTVQHSPQAYNTVVTSNAPRYVPNAGSDFHVSGQNYGTQPGGQVGGGGGSVGVPGGRGPPPLSGLQSIGQSAAGIPPGGPSGGQAPPQAPAPGVQTQQPQGPAPTTTPPVHTPSPQEMGKQTHLQPQPQSLAQVYGPTQTRPTSQGYYTPGPRPQQPRGISHRGGQGGTGAQVVGMSGVGGGGGQPTAIYHTAGLPVQTGAMYQVPNLHPGAHQQSVYPMNSQIPLQYSGPPQRHQTHQNQSYYTPFPHSALLTQNMFGYGAPAPTQPYFWTPTGQPANAPISLSRAGASAVTGGAQHVAGPLAGAQGAPVVPQGTLQQPTQQGQPLPPLGISLSQTDMYSGHNGGATNTASNTTKSRKPRGQNAITDIVDPNTGKNISHEIYKDETIQSGESSNRDTPQQQNNGAVAQFDSSVRVRKVVNEESDSDSSVPTNTSETTTSQSVTQSLSNVQTNSINDANNQCNTGPPTPTQNIPNTSAICSQSLGTTPSNVAQVDSCAIKPESKSLQVTVKEFHPRGEIKSNVVVIEEPPSTARTVNKDDISVQLSAMAVTDVETKSSNIVAAVAVASVTATSPSPSPSPSSSSTSTSTASHERNSSSVPPPVSVSTTNVSELPKSSVTAPSATPLPAREPFPNLSSKATPTSPPRRKSQTHAHNQPTVTELPPSSAKEQKEKKTREKSLSSRGATPTPVHNQTTEHHHQKANGDATTDKSEPEVVSRNDVQQQKASDGKATQKQKNKNKLKPRELNRKGAEKEGTDMDAFVNTASTAKPEGKQENKEPALVKDSNKEMSKEIPKEVKEKDNYETKKEKEILSGAPKGEKHVTSSLPPEVPKETPAVQAPVVEKLPSNKENVKESSPTIEDTPKLNACNFPAKPVPNDVVDHAKVKEDIDLEAIVAQKNEENVKVSLLRVSNEENSQPATEKLIEKQYENETPPQTVDATPAASNPLPLKYKYKEGQWSPLNKDGKKVYDRDFLMKLQNDPHSKLKPSNLPDLDVVLKDGTKPRSTVDLRSFKDANMSRHDALYPSFVKPVLNTRMTPASRKSAPGRPKPSKPNVIHMSLSLREDVKLRETENAWRPTRLKQSSTTEEDAKTEALYKKVRSVLNKLTPQKFSTLVDQVRSLTIDTLERLQGVINLVFEKAVDEPNFSVAYAFMCKELALMKVTGAETSEKDSSFNFRKLILARCQAEYEKQKINEIVRSAKLKEIEECTDPEMKKELQSALEEEDRRQRMKSVGNTRFIGELYKQGMLTTQIIHRCISELLAQNHEDSFECLCKLLTTVGKDLDGKGPVDEMDKYFNKMRAIISQRGEGKISSRIRFMLQDVIDLRANKWIPRRNDSNPKTIDEIQKEAESERLDCQLNNTPLNTPRKDDRNMDRKRNRGVGLTDDGWSQAGGRSRQPYSVETAKLKNKPPPMDDLQLGNRTAYVWKSHNTANNSKTIYPTNKFACLDNVSLDQEKRMSPQLSGSRSTGPREYGRDYKSSYGGRNSRNGSHQSSSASSSRDTSLLDTVPSQNMSMSLSSLKPAPQSTSSSNSPPMSQEELNEELNRILKEYLKNCVVEKTAVVIQQTFNNAWLQFSRETINFVLERSPMDRERISRLISHLISQKILPLQHFRDGFTEVLAIVDDLIIDIPKIWAYLAEILSYPIEDDAIPIAELKPLFDYLKGQVYAGKLLGEVLSRVCRDKGPKWAADKWDQSGLQLNSIIDPKQNIDEIIKEYELEFLKGDYNSAKSSTNSQLSFQQIHEQLRRLMKQNTFDEICSWIIANAGNQVKEPKFVRILTTAILETCIENINGKWQLKEDTLISLQQLIRRFVDANEVLELQCLYAIQSHIAKLEHPYGIILPIVKSLADHNIISNDAFLAWRDSKDPSEREGHCIATMSLTTFFKSLQERADDASSVEDVATGVGQDRC